ncbi:MAG: Bor family protein [Candidatus Pacebacteria bacterium]|nr:Bor family protein [Candidatus Paceibacterota bacterium]
MKSLIAASLVSVVLLSGCAAQKFNINGTANTGEVRNSTFFISGIGQTDTIDAASMCQGAAKVQSVQAQQSFLNILLGAVTFGIYTPRSYKVTCSS